MTAQYPLRLAQQLRNQHSDNVTDEAANLIQNMYQLLTELSSQPVCQCDMDYSEGEPDPNSPDRQFNDRGEPIWGDTCIFCKIRLLLNNTPQEI